MLISIKSSSLAVLVLLVFVAHLDSGDAKIHIRRHKSQSKDNKHGAGGKTSKGSVYYHDDHGNAQKGADSHQSCQGEKKSCNGTSHGGSIPPIPKSHCSTKIPQITGVSSSDKPIPLSGGQSFDCKNQLYENDAGPVFYITGNATLSNCFFAQTGTLDTIEIVGQGNVHLNNIFLLSVGDDGISVKGNMNVYVKNGVCLNADNKCIQHDGKGVVDVKDFCLWNVHIGFKSCGNCKVNADKSPRIINLDSISVDSTVKTVCAANVNDGDQCNMTHIYGHPSESLCTTYNGISNPHALPEQKTKNIRNPTCSF